MKLNRYTAIAVSAAALIGTLGMAAPASAATLGSSCPLASSGSNRTVYSYFQPVRHQADMTAFYTWLLSQAKLAPVAKAPTTQAPAAKAPVTQAPAAKAPAAQAPAADTVVTDKLIADAPVAQAPVQQAQVQKAPAQQAPAQQAPATQAPATTQTQASNAAGMTAEEQQMLTLINGARAQAGLKPLQADAKLTQLARMKSQDMINRNYFDHNSPTYGSPFQMMQTYGVTYQTAGENIAGNPSVEGAFQAWMNSPGHRANILKADFNTTGIGIVHGGQYGIMFTQEFVGR